MVEYIGRISFDFKHRSIEFVYKGKKHVLRGASTGLKVVKSKTLAKEGKFFMFAHVPQAVEVAQCHNIQAIQSEGILPSFASLISHYSCLFELPTTLPPHRNSFDYRIPLIDKTNPINKIPYRYPGIKKDVNEKLVQEMLDQGVLQHSTSPYSSPVVLVGKKDGSWRLYVD